MISRLKKLIKYLSFILVFLSFLFITKRLTENWNEIRAEIQAHPFFLWRIIIGSFFYGILNLLLAGGWYSLMISLHNSHGQRKNLFIAFARSQIAKYIPGNIFHFAGRHVLLRKLGFSHRIIAAGMFMELFALVASALVLILATVILGFDKINIITSYLGNLSLIGLVVVILIIPLFLYLLLFSSKMRRFGLYDTISSERKRRIQCFNFPLSVLQFIIYFIITSTIFYWILNSVVEFSSRHYFTVLTFYIISWMLGFVTPGSPAGMGIREMVLIGTLSTIVPVNGAMVAAIGFRLVTTLGDTYFFMFSYLFAKNEIVK